MNEHLTADVLEQLNKLEGGTVIYINPTTHDIEIYEDSRDFEDGVPLSSFHQMITKLWVDTTKGVI